MKKLSAPPLRAYHYGAALRVWNNGSKEGLQSLIIRRVREISSEYLGWEIRPAL
jgi:hypothetical protein